MICLGMNIHHGLFTFTCKLSADVWAGLGFRKGCPHVEFIILFIFFLTALAPTAQPIGTDKGLTPN